MCTINHSLLLPGALGLRQHAADVSIRKNIALDFYSNPLVTTMRPYILPLVYLSPDYCAPIQSVDLLYICKAILFQLNCWGFQGKFFFPYSAYIDGVKTLKDGSIFPIKLNRTICIFLPFLLPTLPFSARQPLRTHELIFTAQSQMYFKKLQSLILFPPKNSVFWEKKKNKARKEL